MRECFCCKQEEKRRGQRRGEDRGGEGEGRGRGGGGEGQVDEYRYHCATILEGTADVSAAPLTSCKS